MFITFVVGTENFITCNLLTFSDSLPHYICDDSHSKVIAISYPFKHKFIMSCCVVTALICISWLLAVAMSIHILFATSGHEIPEYSICLVTGISFLKAILAYAVPIFIEAVVTTLLNIYLSIKAYQVRKQTQNETRLSSATSQVEA